MYIRDRLICIFHTSSRISMYKYTYIITVSSDYYSYIVDFFAHKYKSDPEKSNNA